MAFYNYSAKVKTRMSSAIRKGLIESGMEVSSTANSNVRLEGEAGIALRGSYRYVVDDGAKVTIGTSREEGYWEEFGTGSWADTSKNGGKKGRQDWWVYNEGEPFNGPESTHYRTETDARVAAARIRAAYGKNAIASNGHKPSYTLENAFVRNRVKIINAFGKALREELS